MHARTHSKALVPALLAVLMVPAVATAQEVDIEVPLLIIDEATTGEGAGESDLDLANIVQSAAKGITTVQEAPVIVTVITAEEIAQRGTRTIEHVTDTVPGWMRLGALHSMFSFGLARGNLQSFMYMRDGVSMFDPMVNTPSVYRVTPIETIKRVEMITGPGGVLWGANSYLGIVNVISKNADDIDGVEANVSFGHGNGDREMGRGYVMAGITDLWSPDSSLLLHSSFETYVGPGFQMPLHIFSAPLPQPNSLTQYGPLVTADPYRSFMFNFSGKLTVGNFNLQVSAPIVERHAPLGFPGYIVQKDFAEDTAVNPDGTLRCPVPEPGQNPIDPTDSGQACLDAMRRARDNRHDFFDRFAIADYRTRVADGKAGVQLKGYLVQFVRDFKQLAITSPSDGLLPGGLSLATNLTNYRTGASFDGDFELGKDVRVLYGAEGFHEWLQRDVTRARQGDGTETTFLGPYTSNLNFVPLPCPQTISEAGTIEYLEGCPLTLGFPASRTVFGAYFNPQWRPTKKLILDAGARAQAAPPSLGILSYEPQFLFSGTAVYNFLPDWHVKLNYAEGFRPPVFNNLISNGEAVQLDGSEDLEVETSDAIQGEVNARIWKGERRIREFNFRADYSYTRLQNLIQINQGRYVNAADRAMHSVEFLGKLYFTGGHRVELGYTWLRMHTADKGTWRMMPEHWFNLAGFFNVVDNKLLVSTNLRVAGAMEDANRLVEHRDLALDETGRPYNAATMTPGPLTVHPHEMVLDRLPPSADLTAGLTYFPREKLTLSAFFYNAFNNRYYQPDGFGDYEPRLEFLPNPMEDFRFVVSATAQY